MILLDLLDQFFIYEPKAALDDQGAKCHVKGFCLCAKALVKLICIGISQFIPWNQFSKLDQMIISRKLPTEWKKAVCTIELIWKVVSINMEKSGQLLGADKPISKQLIPIPKHNRCRTMVFDFS